MMALKRDSITYIPFNNSESVNNDVVTDQFLSHNYVFRNCLSTFSEAEAQFSTVTLISINY